MIIYSMTATFGKLENETLRLKKGLNLIEAPNEWGKSTWCAFLLAMFYGIDTRSRTSRQSISDKERFQPWSGNPMEGRIELEWQGRDITIERTTRGRIPMGVFRAYETASGLPIPELRGDNCGELILGVERSVYQHSGYIRALEMSITNDEPLRNRLNNLVSTGDDSGEEAILTNGLKELKKRLQYHKNGLIPQLEAEIGEITEQISLAESNTEKLNGFTLQLRENEDELKRLRNHLDYIENLQAMRDQREVKRALLVMQTEEQKLSELREICSKLPERNTVQSKLDTIQDIQTELHALRISESLIEEPVLRPEPTYGFIPCHGAEQAKADAQILHSAQSALWLVCFLLGIINLAGAIFLALCIKEQIGACVVGLVGLVGIWLGMACLLSNKKKKKALLQKYGNFRSDRWEIAGRQFDQSWITYLEKRNKALDSSESIKKQTGSLESRRTSLLEGKDISYYYETLNRWNELEEAEGNYIRALENYKAVNAMARSSWHPSYKDDLNYPEEETRLLIEQKINEVDSLRKKIFAIQYSMEKCESLEKLRDRKKATQTRLQKLRKIHAAVLIAQQNQQLAMEELHRRFSPGITNTAQKYLTQMSGGKYNKLQFQEDFSAFAGSDKETVLHSSLYRSEGTADQIYFALRLAVSQELIPEVPLILDDAFIRFDDERLKDTLQILKEISNAKQIILFSCQSREKSFLT